MASARVPEETPHDFIAYLEERWAVRREVAVAVLAESLQRYQPIERRSIRILRPKHARIIKPESAPDSSEPVI